MCSRQQYCNSITTSATAAEDHEILKRSAPSLESKPVQSLDLRAVLVRTRITVSHGPLRCLSIARMRCCVLWATTVALP